MNFKMIIIFVDDKVTEKVLDASRKAGATGATVINNARGEGLNKPVTFFGLDLDSQCDVILMLVESHTSKHILQEVGRVGQFDETPGTGIAFQIDVEDAIGVKNQMAKLAQDSL
jgi:nitrogen regulatory protein PII